MILLAYSENIVHNRIVLILTTNVSNFIYLLFIYVQNLPIYIWDAGLAGMFYGFPAQSGSPGGVKVAMHFQKSDSSSVENTCTPDSLDRTVKDKEVNEVS